MIQDTNHTTVEDDVRLSSNLSITLTRNAEIVGVGLVPTERARALVPDTVPLARRHSAGHAPGGSGE